MQTNAGLSVTRILQCKQWQTWQSLDYALRKTTTDWWCVTVTSVVLCNNKLEQAVLSSNNNDRLVVLSNRTSPFMAPTEDQQRKFGLTQRAAAWPTRQFCVLAETTWRCWSYLSDLQHDACLLIVSVRPPAWRSFAESETGLNGSLQNLLQPNCRFSRVFSGREASALSGNPSEWSGLDLHSDYQTTAKTATKLC